MAPGKSCFEDAACSGEGLMDDETHVAIDLAIEADAELLREALAALERAISLYGDRAARSGLGRRHPSLGQNWVRQARATITKLEERLK